MITQGHEGRIGTSALLWGIFWRSVLWYTVAGVVLGGLYGCAFAGSIVFFLSIPLGIAGVVFGWIAVRGTRMRPLLGGLIGALIGLSVGGFPLMFAYGLALLFGGTFGAMYGLAAGLLCGIVIPVITRARYYPLIDVRGYRRFVVIASPTLCTLAVSCVWLGGLAAHVPPLSDAVQESYIQLDGLGSFVILAAIPSLLFALTAEWMGSYLADWYEAAAGSRSGILEEPWTTLAPWLSNPKTRNRVLYATGGALLLGAGIVAVIFGNKTYEHRHERIDLPPRGTYGLFISLFPEKGHFTVHTDTRFHVWSLDEKRSVRSLPIHGDDVAEMSPDGKLIAIEDEIRVRLLDARDGSEVVTLPPVPVTRAGSFAWSPDGSRLAVLDENGGGLRLYDARSYRLLREIDTGHSLDWTAVFSPGGRLLATYDWDSIRIWRVEDGRLLREIKAKEVGGAQYYSAAFSPDGETLAIGSLEPGYYAGEADGVIELYSIANGEVVQRRDNVARSVTALDFNESGDLLASGGGNGEVAVWRTSDLRILDAHEEGHDNEGFVSDIAFAPGGDRVISASGDDHTVRIWPVEENE